MDLATIQAIGAVVNGIGLPGTIGIVIILTAIQLLPVLKAYLMSKISVNTTAAASIAANNKPPPVITHIPS
jgi:hypothetical protein